MTEIIEVSLTPEQIAVREAWAAEESDRQKEAVQKARQSAYQMKADPLFFKYQAGEATEEEWLQARAEVVKTYPYPDES